MGDLGSEPVTTAGYISAARIQPIIATALLQAKLHLLIINLPLPTTLLLCRPS